MVRRRRYRKPYRKQKIQNLHTVEAVTQTPSFAKTNRSLSKSIGQGLKYELDGHHMLLDTYGCEYVPGPWFRYTTTDAPDRQNYVQPDGLIIRMELGLVTIVEFKWSHTPDAYYQLFDKYLPVVEKFFGADLFEFRLLEICKFYSSQVKVPGRSSLRKDIGTLQPNEMGIHIWKP